MTLTRRNTTVKKGTMRQENTCRLTIDFFFILSIWEIDGFPAKPKPTDIFTVPAQQELGAEQDGAVQLPADATITDTNTETSATVNGQDESSNAPATPAAPAKPKSWAELLRTKNPATPSPAVVANGTAAQKPVEANKATTVNGAKFDGIADVLHKYQTTYSSVLIQPRGLVNNGNMCFMNAVSYFSLKTLCARTLCALITRKIRNDALTLFVLSCHAIKPTDFAASVALPSILQLADADRKACRAQLQEQDSLGRFSVSHQQH